MKKKLVLTLMVALTLFFPIMVNAIELEHGDFRCNDGEVRNGSITFDSRNFDWDDREENTLDMQSRPPHPQPYVLINKTVTNETELGVYKVEFTINGVNNPTITNAILTDKIGEHFTYVEGSASEGVVVNGKNISYTSANITSETKISFKIKIDALTPEARNFTNDISNSGVKFSYTSVQNSKTMVFGKSPEVCWDKRYEYTINYYRDVIGETNFIISTIGIAKEGDVINVEENKHLPIGYKTIADGTTLTIVNEGANTIDIVYEKRNDLKYTVKYYYDGVHNANMDYTVEDIIFGDIIRSVLDRSTSSYYQKSIDKLPYTIGVENNVINVYYEKIKPAVNEIIPPKTGVEENDNLLLYLSPMLLMFLKKKLI